MASNKTTAERQLDGGSEIHLGAGLNQNGTHSDYVRRIVADAPPLGDHQRRRIAALLTAAGGMDAAA